MKSAVLHHYDSSLPWASIIEWCRPLYAQVVMNASDIVILSRLAAMSSNKSRLPMRMMSTMPWAINFQIIFCCACQAQISTRFTARVVFHFTDWLWWAAKSSPRDTRIWNDAAMRQLLVSARRNSIAPYRYIRLAFMVTSQWPSEASSS